MLQEVLNKDIKAIYIPTQRDNELPI